MPTPSVYIKPSDGIMQDKLRRMVALVPPINRIAVTILRKKKELFKMAIMLNNIFRKKKLEKNL